MGALVNVVLLGWIPLAVILFAWLKPRRGMIVGVVGGMMFMPMATIPDSPIIPFTKVAALSCGLLVAVMVIDPRRLISVRPRLVDLPMLLVCLTPAASAVANGMGPDDAFRAFAGTAINYGFPYYLGRMYLTDVYALREMAMGLFTGGLVYAPLCLLEMIISPQLHRLVYGYHPHPDFSQTVRWGGYRPMMFMQHGLMVGLFMCCAALVGFWMWSNGAAKKWRHWPFVLPLAFVAVIAVWCKSTGAVLLAATGLGLMLATRYLKSYVPLYLLMIACPVYMVARSATGWTGENLVTFVQQNLNNDAASSLKMRFDNENILVARAMQRALLGWGHMGDNLLRDADGKIISVPDGMWVIAVGQGGLIYLIATWAAFLLPPLMLFRRYPAKLFGHPAFAAPGALAVFICLYAIDNLMNAMPNPMYYVALGGVAALAVAKNPVPVRQVKPPQRGFEVTLRRTGPQPV